MATEKPFNISASVGTANQIRMNHRSINEVHANVEQAIEQISAAQELLHNVDDYLLAKMKGKGAYAFTTLSNENHATLKSAIEKTRELNQKMYESNQTAEQTDAALSGKMGG